jgi:hypothetical protein
MQPSTLVEYIFRLMRVAYLNAVKSVRQRALVQHWREIGGGKLPSFEHFQPPARDYDPRQMMGWLVEGEGENLCFRTLQHGKFLSEAFHIDPLPLQVMNAVVPEPLQQLAISGLKECAEARAPMYWVISTRDDGGRRVNCERLLLPFGENNKTMQIITSLQLISYDGEFTRQTVLAFFAREATVAFKAQIAFR